MAQCYTTLDDNDLDHMFLQAPEVIQEVRSKGAVTDEFLDRLEIAKLPEGAHINRDSLVTWRQHAHVLSHDDSREKFINYLQMRADKNNPVLQLQLKQQNIAAKIVARETAASEKAAGVIREKVTKAAEKVAEKERRQALTPAQAKAEVLERKAESARRKVARVNESAERLRAALDIIGSRHIADENDNNFVNENDAMNENNFDEEYGII